MARLAGLFLLLLGLLPLANWIPGGHEAPWYGDRLDLWVSGSAILLGVAAIAAIVLRRRPEVWREGAWQHLAMRWHAAGWRADATVALVAFGCYVAVAQLVLSGRPLLIDEVIQAWQAQVLAAGKLVLPVPEFPEFTAAMHLVETAGRRYGQFPIGGPAMLAIGAVIGATWLVGPLAAATAVLLAARLFRRVEPAAGTALAAVLLFAFAPYVAFLAGSMMNHVTTLTWLLAAALALVLATRDATPRPGPALLAGLALGIAATIRPLDAVAFALPTAAWFLWRLRGGAAQLKPLLASGLGVAVPIAVMLFVNAQWTGDPLRFGYIELWGETHALGFHQAPWGPAHTPARGIELVNLYLLRLQSHFLESPAPGLLFATATLLLMRGVRPIERWALAGGALLLLSYFAYWHDGYYLGPRFVLPLAPWLAWWSARLPAVLRERAVAPPVARAVTVAGVAALAIGAAQLLPIRARQYRNGMLTMRQDPAAVAAAAGVRGATVLVRESWGAQLMARMWGVGVSRPDAERIYRTTDACMLDEALAVVEGDGGDATDLTERLVRHQADSASLVALRLSPDTTLRALPGTEYGPRCVRRILEDRAGFTLWAPVLLVDDGNRWLRDLHARDSLVLRSGEPVWLLLKDTTTGAPLRLEPVDLDSMWAEWRAP